MHWPADDYVLQLKGDFEMKKKEGCTTYRGAETIVLTLPGVPLYNVSVEFVGTRRFIRLKGAYDDLILKYDPRHGVYRYHLQCKQIGFTNDHLQNAIKNAMSLNNDVISNIVETLESRRSNITERAQYLLKVKNCPNQKKNFFIFFEKEKKFFLEGEEKNFFFGKREKIFFFLKERKNFFFFFWTTKITCST